MPILTPSCPNYLFQESYTYPAIYEVVFPPLSWRISPSPPSCGSRKRGPRTEGKGRLQQLVAERGMGMGSEEKEPIFVPFRFSLCHSLCIPSPRLPSHPFPPAALCTVQKKRVRWSWWNGRLQPLCTLVGGIHGHRQFGPDFGSNIFKIHVDVKSFKKVTRFFGKVRQERPKDNSEPLYDFILLSTLHLSNTEYMTKFIFFKKNPPCFFPEGKKRPGAKSEVEMREEFGEEFPPPSRSSAYIGDAEECRSSSTVDRTEKYRVESFDHDPLPRKTVLGREGDWAT